MSDLNLNSTKGIIYIVLIIVGCLVGLWVLNWLKDKYKSVAFMSEKDRKQSASERIGGRRRKLKRPRK